MTHKSLQLINPWSTNSRSNWNLEMLVFEEGGKPENPEKNPRSKGENQQQTQSTYGAGSGSRTRDTLVVGGPPHHCVTPPQIAEVSVEIYLLKLGVLCFPSIKSVFHLCGYPEHNGKYDTPN